MKYYWGENVEHMVSACCRIRHQKGAMYVDDKEKTIRTEHVGSCRLGLISYSGQGKYQDNTLHWYDEHPSDDAIW